METRIERMTKKGEERFETLLADNGGYATLSWTANFLNITEEELIRIADKRCIVSFTNNNGHLLFPRFQFNDTERNVKPSIQSFLPLIKNIDDKEFISFLLTPYNLEHNQNTPLDLLSNHDIEQTVNILNERHTQRS